LTALSLFDEATGCRVSLSIFQRDDAIVLMDLQLAEKPYPHSSLLIVVRQPSQLPKIVPAVAEL
jgi:hypothetical protein